MANRFKPPVKNLTEIDATRALYENDPCVVEGVVSPQSQGGSFADNYDRHGFTFAAWRKQGGALVEQELYLMRAVPKRRRLPGSYLDDFTPYSIQRFRVLLSKCQTR